MDSNKKINIYIHLPISTFDYVEEDEKEITEKVCSFLQSYKKDYSIKILRDSKIYYSIFFWEEIKKLCGMNSLVLCPFSTFSKYRFERQSGYIDLMVIIDTNKVDTSQLLSIAKEKGLPTFVIPCRMKRKAFEFRDGDKSETIEIPYGYSFSVEYECKDEYTWRERNIVRTTCLVNNEDCGIGLSNYKNILYIKKNNNKWGYYEGDVDDIIRYTTVHSARELFEMIKKDIKEYISNPTHCCTKEL